MAKLIVLLSDEGHSIPLSGTLFWDAVGTASVETFEVQAGTSARINGGGGVDLIRLLGNVTDYTVKLSGSSAVFTHTATAQTVTVPMNMSGDQIQFGESGTLLDLKIIPPTIEAPEVSFNLGSQPLTDTDAPITGGGGGAQVVVSVDGQGMPAVPVNLDASVGAFRFTDAAGVANNVQIAGYGADDLIVVSGATSVDYDAGISSNETGGV